jgi:hypothetical protein
MPGLDSELDDTMMLDRWHHDGRTSPNAPTLALARPNWLEGKHTTSMRAATVLSMLPTPASMRQPNDPIRRVSKDVAHSDAKTVRSPTWFRHSQAGKSIGLQPLHRCGTYHSDTSIRLCHPSTMDRKEAKMGKRGL